MQKGVLEILQNSQENTCARVKRLWHRCFPVNFVKFVRTPFLQNTSGRLLLKVEGKIRLRREQAHRPSKVEK